MLLEHNAGQWFKKWASKNPALSDWNLFQQALFNKFKQRKNSLLIAATLKKVTQKGTIGEYYQIYKETQATAPPNIDFNHPWVQQMYLNGLNPNVVQYVQLNNCDTLEDLYCKAKDAEDKSNILWAAI